MATTETRHLGSFIASEGWRRLGPKQDKFIGPSGLPKPQPVGDVGHIADGATCLEEDTGRIFRWRGTYWVASPEDPTADLLVTLIEHVASLRETLELFVDRTL